MSTDVADVTTRRGAPVSTVPRTLIDLAGCLPPGTCGRCPPRDDPPPRR